MVSSGFNINGNMKKKLLVSVSGGRTSALMAKLLWDRFKDVYEMVFVFANTSREMEETLIFVDNISKHWGIPITWVEAVVHHGERKGCTHKIVDFNSAKRDGSVFEEVIKKYGIPAKPAPHCTRELKRNAINSYAKSIGFKNATTAIGYRADEPKRVDLVKAKQKNQYYPLWEWGIKKEDVLGFFKRQIFDLGLQEHQGNCKMCYKKTDRKIITQMLEMPEDRWVQQIELNYSMYRPSGFKKNKPPFYFFRGGQSSKELLDKVDKDFEPYKDNNKTNFDFELDEIEYGGCAESCEPF